jgi:hypothetical protein
MSTHHTDSTPAAEAQARSIATVSAAVTHRLNRPPTLAKATAAARLRATAGRIVRRTGLTAPLTRAMILRTERRAERHERLYPNTDERRITSDWLATRFPDAPAWRRDLVADRLLERHVTIIWLRIVVKDGYGTDIYHGWATAHDRFAAGERHRDFDAQGRAIVKDGFGRVISHFPEIDRDDHGPDDVTTRFLFAPDLRTEPR